MKSPIPNSRIKQNQRRTFMPLFLVVFSSVANPNNSIIEVINSSMGLKIKKPQIFI